MRILRKQERKIKIAKNSIDQIRKLEKQSVQHIKQKCPEESYLKSNGILTYPILQESVECDNIPVASSK